MNSVNLMLKFKTYKCHDYKVHYLLFALFVYSLPVAQETANIESGKIMFRLTVQSDTLLFYFDSNPIFEKALREFVFNYTDFSIENFNKIQNDQLPIVVIALYIQNDKKDWVDGPDEAWRCIGLKSCEIECIEQEINGLWMDWKCKKL